MSTRDSRITTTEPSNGPRSFASAMISGVVDATASPQEVYNFNALWVGGAGNVTIQHTTGGTAVQYVGVAAGTILPVRGVAVTSATTATNIVWMKW